MKEIILDLCGGTGSWAKPWKDAGFSVHTITLPEYDITKTKITEDFITFTKNGSELDNVIVVRKSAIYGILAAPPCTMFSFARTNAKKPRDLKEGMECVRACLNIIWSCMEIKQSTGKKTLPLKFWALENPAHGFLRNFLGKPSFIFEPYEFGDMYRKKTALWGKFAEPKKQEHKLEKMVKFDYLKSKDIHPEFFGKFDRQTRRSITPQGFAEAFYQANE